MEVVRNKCRTLEGNHERKSCQHMLDVVVESLLCLCFYNNNKNLHYAAIAHQQRVSSTTLYIPFESRFAKRRMSFLMFIRGF